MARVLAAYQGLLDRGELRPDAAQAAVAVRLDALADALERPVGKPGFFARLKGGTAAPVRGVYLHGGVGRGKSMMMDLFYAHLDASPKRRVHFHEFMLEIHARLHAERGHGGADPLRRVAAEVAAGARLLAFDEMQVKDIADAAILARRFEGLFAAGVADGATSDRVPGGLYKQGLNRQLFLPFIALIEARCDVLGLDGPTDYRMARLGGAPTWHVPNGPAAADAMAAAFFRMTDYPVEDRAMVPTETIDVPGGRTLFVPKSLKGVAVFSFSRLCRKPLGAADYLAVARRFHTVFLVGIPVMGPESRNEATRFITLIDALYEQKVKLIAAADAEPAGLYVQGDNVFEFERTVSRVMEMQSVDYLALGHGS
ncbi:cell division protein ZapE [Polymorphobacter multimanifer]|uniref:cell division protein ZapE n=1 Tax=Polymorphobacter multimanifer TaxID=1070431 RepID=UPI00166B27DC|nr:cell division protein ZapE [Polymorphobacter multimanifer]GGI91729.1 cell division protein ZapE [Polymorphobacter multimanifer]